MIPIKLLARERKGVYERDAGIQKIDATLEERQEHTSNGSDGKVDKETAHS